MRVTFYGAAQTTTGSMHELEIAGTRCLLDCGLYQGKRKEAFERNRHLPFDPSALPWVLLSHAHIDHSGNLPTLVRQGFRGQILATAATRDLCELMLRDSAHLQEKDVQHVNKKRARQGKNLFEPLYTENDIDPTLERFRTVSYGEEVPLGDGLTVRFHDAGHILGSSLISLQWRYQGSPRRLLFTGDLGRPNMPILRDPEVVRDVDVLITESTYGEREHPPMADVTGRLKGFVEDIVAQRSKLLIPSFSVGRTQQVLYYLHRLYREGRICPVPVYVDSPLSVRATEVHRRHPECFDTETLAELLEGDDPFSFRCVRFITEVEDSKKLNDEPGPAIIISASGMCEGGRILHHLKHHIGDPRTLILFVGFQAVHTLGRRLVERQNPVRIFGEEYSLEARVHTLNALSGHADRAEMLAYIRAMGRPPKQAFVVHGEPPAAGRIAEELRNLGVSEIRIPAPGETFPLADG